jgi:tRNA threonylcarbamoyladenosine biosynthesis protein TsaB
MTDYSEKNILGIDTSTSRLNLGLRFGGDRLVKSSEVVDQSHGQIIVKKIGELFQSAGLAKTDLDAIVVATGPGSFTGLRIGIAAGKGVAVSLGLPMVGVNLFEIAAYRLRDRSEAVTVAVPLKRDEFFVTTVNSGEYDHNGISVVKARDLARESNNGPIAVYGIEVSPEWQITGPDLSSDIGYDSSELILLGSEKLSRGEADDLVTLEPLYLQKSQAEINFELRHKK